MTEIFRKVKRKKENENVIQPFQCHLTRSGNVINVNFCQTFAKFHSLGVQRSSHLIFHSFHTYLNFVHHDLDVDASVTVNVTLLILRVCFFFIYRFRKETYVFNEKGFFSLYRVKSFLYINTYIFPLFAFLFI